MGGYPPESKFYRVFGGVVVGYRTFNPPVNERNNSALIIYPYYNIGYMGPLGDNEEVKVIVRGDLGPLTPQLMREIEKNSLPLSNY